MADVAGYFDQHSRRSVEYIDYDGAITALGGTGSVHRTRAGIEVSMSTTPPGRWCMTEICRRPSKGR